MLHFDEFQFVDCFPFTIHAFAFLFKKYLPRDFPGGPVIKTPHFHCWGHGFNPWWGTKIPHVALCGQKKKKKEKKYLPSSRSQRFPPVFSSRSCIVLALAFRPEIHFELIFVYGVG